MLNPGQKLKFGSKRKISNQTIYCIRCASIFADFSRLWWKLLRKRKRKIVMCRAQVPSPKGLNLTVDCRFSPTETTCLKQIWGENFAGHKKNNQRHCKPFKISANRSTLRHYGQRKKVLAWFLQNISITGSLSQNFRFCLDIGSCFGHFKLL